MKSEEIDFLVNQKKRFNTLYQMYRDGVKTALVGTITDIDAFCNTDIKFDYGTEKIYRAMELMEYFKKREEELDTKIKEIV